MRKSVALAVLGLALFLGCALLSRLGPAPGYVAAQGDIIVQQALREKDPASPQAATITVSGTVTGPGGPVPGVWIGVGSPLDWRETTTDASGSYSLEIRTDGQLWFAVRPDVVTRLTQANHWVDGVTANFTQDFTVTAGYLLNLQVTGAGGDPVTGGLGFDVQPLQNPLWNDWWYGLDWDEGAARYWAVLPPDVYYVTARRPPAGYYETTQAFDLRLSDQVVEMALSATYVHPIPYDPPDAGKIIIGLPDDLGEALVTGTPGAALPLAHVLLVNLNSTHQAHAISEANGSFTAEIYAPPGSAVMVKHGPASWRWNDLTVGLSEGVNPFPGTIINVPHTHTGDQYELPFAAAGAIDYYVDDPNTTHNYVGSAWAITGTLGPVVVEGAWTRVLTGTYDGQVVPGLYVGGLNWTHPALGDLDGDGDLDLLIGERSGHLVLYRNEGSPASPNWAYKTADYAGVATGDWAYPALADATGDGVLDLFVGAGNGTVAVYYNAGTPTVPAWPDVPDESLSVSHSAAPALDDLDGDGDLDLLVGHGGGTLTHFENVGTAASPAWMLQSSNYGGISEASEGLQPAFVDLDGDGDLDLLIGLCGQLVWYRRGGTIGNPTWTRVGGDPISYGGGSCANSPSVGDWDGDGDRDLVVGEHWGALRFFRNNGAPSWAEQGFSFPFDLAGDSAPALADWDGDGDLDMLIGQAHGQVYRYTNVGSATNPAWRYDDVLLTLPWTNHPHPFPTLADIDGDGDYDLFVGEGGWQGEGAGGNIHYYHNDGTPSSPSWTLVTDAFLGLDVGGWSTPTFVDIDGDGDLDLFVGDEEGTLTFLENTGTATSPAWAAPAQLYAGLDLGSYSAPAFLDADQDGDLDMLAGLESGSLAYVRNAGMAASPAWELVTTAHPQIHVGHRATPVAADMDGDGVPDLVIGDGDGGLNLYLYDGPGSPPPASGRFAPGDPLQIQGTLRLHSPAITSTTDLDAIQASGWLNMTMLFDQAGDAMPAENYFMSTMLTPGGLPIQRTERASQGLGGPVSFQDLRYLGGHAVEGDFTFTGRLPASTLPGVYRPWLWLEFTGVPTSTDWLAANVTQFTFGTHQAPLSPIVVGDVEPPRLAWQLLTDDIVQGTRGTGAHEDRGSFQLASQIVTQGAPYYTPPTDVRSGQPITYRLEPFLPAVSFTDRRMPAPPLIPFDLPGGQLHVVVQEPDGTTQDLGSEALAQSFNRTKTTRAGHDLNSGTVQLEDVYSLQAASERFRLTFDQYGHHVITMTGTVDDLWGNTYAGGGTYDVWIAQPLDIDPGVLPGTSLAVGDAFNPAVQVYPRVPADVRLTFTLYPDSDPSQAMTHTLSGRANRFGYFSPSDLASRLTRHGEYRVDLTAAYTDPSGTLYMSAMTWGGVVMTPQSQGPHLVARGRRGVDSLSSIPGNAWFVSCRDLPIRPGDISHTLNPYFNGDVLWSRMVDAPGECPAGVTSGGDSLVMGASVQDTVGAIEAAIQARHHRMWPGLAAPGSFAERVAAGELPLFISTRSGQAPQLLLGKIGETIPDDVDQIAYSYRSSQRPGVRVRELVAEDGQSGGYWRLDTLYDDQLGVGVLGDQPNDFKFQYLGLVFRDLQTGHNEYLGHGSGWIFIPDDDLRGSRAMPPFAGPGNGGWTQEGGPLLTLKGEDVHIFILPTGTRPGAVLEVGDTFRFAGHIMPTLDSQVAVTVTSPGGVPHVVAGQANSVGYFYDPDDDFVVEEPGLWSVDVRVWHDGACSGGTTVSPYPSGDVLGSEGGRYWFYVVPAGSPRLEVSAPAPGFLSFEGDVSPITIAGSLPAGLGDVVVDYTIAMPGFILEHGQATVSGETYQLVFDPATLSQTFPNLDLIGRDDWRPGLADTFAIGLLLQGQSGAGRVYRANTVTIQGEQVFVGQAQAGQPPGVYLPLILKGN